MEDQAATLRSAELLPDAETVWQLHLRAAFPSEAGRDDRPGAAGGEPSAGTQIPGAAGGEDGGARGERGQPGHGPARLVQAGRVTRWIPCPNVAAVRVLVPL
jgi:hypothetical protein